MLGEQEHIHREPKTLPYHGGNEVFFSFIQSLLLIVDQGELSLDHFAVLVRGWGRHIGQQSELEGDLLEDLDRITELLSTLGLVRVFEPVENAEGEVQILVLRCMLSRYVGESRLRENLSFPAVLGYIVEGALYSAGLYYRVVESREGMPRFDEYLLTLSSIGD